MVALSGDTGYDAFTPTTQGEAMHEDAYLDIFMEDRISGPDYDDGVVWDEPDYYFDEEEYDPEPREDFGWFGEAGLWD